MLDRVLARMVGGAPLDPGCVQYLWEGLRACGDVSFVLRAAPLPCPPALAADLDAATAVVGSADLLAHSLGLHDPSVGLSDPQQKILEAVAQVRFFAPVLPTGCTLLRPDCGSPAARGVLRACCASHCLTDRVSILSVLRLAKPVQCRTRWRKT